MVRHECVLTLEKNLRKGKVSENKPSLDNIDGDID